MVVKVLFIAKQVAIFQLRGGLLVEEVLMCGKRLKKLPPKNAKKSGKKLVTLGQILEHAGAGNYVGGLKYWNTPVVWGRRSPRQRRMR